MTTQFAIISTQRSGTTMVKRDLNTHPDVFVHDEVYSVRSPAPDNYVAYRGHLPWRPPGAHLSALFDRPEAAIGLIIMYNHLRLPTLKRALQRRKPKLVHIVRKNALKQYVSYLVAQSRGTFASTVPLEVTQVQCPVEGLVEKLQTKQRLVEKHRDWCAKLEHLEIGYEAVVADRGAQQDRLLRFLGVDSYPLDAGTVKLNPDDLSAVVTNYDEVVSALTGTPYEHLLA